MENVITQKLQNSLLSTRTKVKIITVIYTQVPEDEEILKCCFNAVELTRINTLYFMTRNK